MRTTFKAISVALLLATSLATPTLAADSGSLISTSRVAVVNVQNIMRDSTAAKSVREQMEAKQKSYQSEVMKKEDALQKEDQELAKQRGAMAKEAFEAKAKALRDKVATAQKEVQTKKASLDAAFERSIMQIQKTVEGIISDLSKEKGFVMAVPTSQILYADTALDISPEVLSRLNQKLPKVDVKFDAPAISPSAGKSEEKKKQ